MENYNKVLPNDIEAEQCVLGCCLIDINSVNSSIEILVQDDFYRKDHQIIFKCIDSLFVRNEPIDIITIKNELYSIGKLESVGGIEYLSCLPEKVPTTANVKKYINIIKEKAIKRNLINLSNELSKYSFDPTVSTEELTDLAERKVFEFTQRKNIQGVSALKDLLISSITNLENICNNGVKKGIPTGFVDIDRRMGGLRGAELIILAARPRNGKISFCFKYSNTRCIKRKYTSSYI